MKLTDLNFDRIYCINLPQRHDRRAFAEKQFNAADLSVQFFDAVNGRDIDYKAVSEKHTPGMVGCFLSHRAIYADAIKNNYARIIIFEDDAQLAPGFEVLMSRALPHLPADWQFAFLGFFHYGNFFDYKAKVNDYWVIPGKGWGTQCYMVNGADTIRRLYAATTFMDKQIDEQLTQDILPNNFNYYFIHPNAVYQNHSLDTDVQTHKNIIPWKNK